MSTGKNNVRKRKGFITKKTYNAFIKKHPTVDITFEQFKMILEESNKAIRDSILENELGFKLPNRLGYIAVTKFKPKKECYAVNWIETRRLGKKIPQLNLHSLGYIYQIKLYKNPNVRSLMVYKMNAHRIIKRMLAAKIKSGTDYLEIDRSYYNRRFNIVNMLKHSE